MGEDPGLIRAEARGWRFDIACDEPVRAETAALFAALARAGGTPAATFALRCHDGAEPRWSVERDGAVLMACNQLSEAVHGLMAYVNRGVIAGRPDLLSVHAAAVAVDGVGVLMPGESGSGKTTLCARLVQRGATYLSDDSVAVEPGGGIVGYPKPLGFKVGTWAEFAGSGLDDLDVDRGRQLVWQVPPARLGAASALTVAPGFVFTPRFEDGAPVTVDELARHEAAAALVRQSQNLGAHGVGPALAAIGAVVARSRTCAITYGDARAAAGAVLEVVASGPPEAPAEFDVIGPSVDEAAPVAPTPAPGVAALCLDDGAVIVREGTGDLATVDAVGARTWRLLDGRRSTADIAAELARRFDAPAPAIEADVARWIDELVAAGFVVGPVRVRSGDGPGS